MNSWTRPAEILLVEDNPGDVRLTLEALKETPLPNHISVAKDGEEAIHFLRRHGAFANAPRPDLILLDLNLPKKSGREILSELKQDPKLRRIPVVVLTSSTAEKDVLEAYDLSANCYVTKPVDLDQYLDVLRKIQDFWLNVARLPTDLS
jgi:two-component system, chemotaxis family, response regulator Rcp1